MLSNILTLACGLGLAYVILLLIEGVRAVLSRRYRKKKLSHIKTVYNYKNEQISQPIKEDRKEK